MKKLYDLTVKTGSYTNKAGEDKGRYVNIGSVMENDKGKFILLNRTFNPAGVPNPENKESIIVSMFAPRDNTKQDAPDASQLPEFTPRADNPFGDDSSEIPF